MKLICRELSLCAQSSPCRRERLFLQCLQTLHITCCSDEGDKPISSIAWLVWKVYEQFAKHSVNGHTACQQTFSNKYNGCQNDRTKRGRENV